MTKETRKKISDTLIKKSRDKYYENPSYCIQCHKIIEIGNEKPSQTKKKKFCSHSCAAIYNNRNRKKNHYTNCIKCGKEFPKNGRKKLCNECNSQIIDWSNITLKEVKNKRSYQGHSRIRDLARKLYFNSNLPKKCLVCNYDFHIEICHIKPIKDFADNTKITDINNLDNLVALCPNHHWELDNGLLNIKKYTSL